MAAKPLGEERGPAQSQGITPVRAAALAALALVVLALIYIAFFAGNGYTYKLVFQNASQLVTDNQVLIGGHPVGSVESIDLTEDNLAEIEISVDQQLHEGTTAIVRATSLSGVANHYVSISPGPNSNPELDDGDTLGKRPSPDHVAALSSASSSMPLSRSPPNCRTHHRTSCSSP